PPDGEGAVDDIMGLLRSCTDVDFTQYKRSTIIRRVRRRMALVGTDAFADYIHYLQNTPAEVQNLYLDFLIRVTRFFPNEQVSDALKAAVSPNLRKQRTANNPNRVWVAGCSTGEEAYSLAICLLEFLGEKSSNLPVKILASDVNEQALEKARAGVYV